MILQACNAACPAHFLVVVRTNDEVIPGVIAGHPHDASDFLSAGAPHVYHLLDSSGIDSSSRPVEYDAAEYLDAPGFGIRRAALVTVSNVVPLRTSLAVPCSNTATDRVFLSWLEAHTPRWLGKVGGAGRANPYGTLFSRYRCCAWSKKAGGTRSG